MNREALQNLLIRSARWGALFFLLILVFKGSLRHCHAGIPLPDRNCGNSGRLEMGARTCTGCSGTSDAGDFEGASHAIGQALDIDPSSLEVRLDEVLIQAAVWSRKMGPPTVESFRRALDREPRLIEVHLATGARLMENARWADAEKVLHAALSPELEIGRYRQVPGNSAARIYRQALYSTVRQNLTAILMRKDLHRDSEQ